MKLRTPPTRSHKSSQKGFVLMELLVALVLISIAVTTFLSGLSQCTKAAGKTEQIAKAVFSLEAVLYELETGERPDLVHYGGKGKTGEFNYTVSSFQENNSVDFTGYKIKTQAALKNGKEILHLETYLGERFSP